MPSGGGGGGADNDVDGDGGVCLWSAFGFNGSYAVVLLLAIKTNNVLFCFVLAVDNGNSKLLGKRVWFPLRM